MKKLIVILLLLLCLRAQGATLYPSRDATMNWTAAEWSLADDNAKNHVAPVDGDSVIFTNNSSATITLDADQIDIELAGLNMTVGPGGYAGTFAMGSNDLDVDGVCALAGTITASGANIEVAGNFAIIGTPLPAGLTITLNGTGNLTTVSGNLAALIIDHAGTTTFLTKGFWGSYRIDDGAVNYANFDLDVVGNIVGTSSVDAQTNQGVWTITGTATASLWTAVSSNETIEHLTIGASGAVTINEGSFLGIRKLTMVSGGTIDKGTVGNIIFLDPLANWWNAESGTINADVQIRGTATDPGDAITIAAGDLTVRGSSWTAAGNVTLSNGDFVLGMTIAAASLDMNGHNLLCTNITIGDDENCTLTLGEGSHTVTGNITEAGGAQVKTIELETSTVHLGGTFDGTGLTVTAGAAARIAVGDNSTAPTLTNVTAGSPVDASGILDGTGNSTNIRFARGLVGGGVF